MRAHRLPIVAAVALFFGSSAIDPLVPALFKWLINAGFKADSAVPLWPVPVVVIGLFAVRGLLGFAGAYLCLRAPPPTRCWRRARTWSMRSCAPMPACTST